MEKINIISEQHELYAIRALIHCDTDYISGNWTKNSTLQTKDTHKFFEQ